MYSKYNETNKNENEKYNNYISVLVYKNTAMRNIKPLIYGTADMTSSHPV